MKTARVWGVFVLMNDDIIGVCQVIIETDCEIPKVKFDIVGKKSIYIEAYDCRNEKDKVGVEKLEKSVSKICHKTNIHI